MILYIGISVLFILVALVVKENFLRSNSSQQATSRGCESPPQVTARWNIPETITIYNQLFQAARNGSIHIFMKSIFSTASKKSGYEVKTVMLARPWADRIWTFDAENIHAILTTKHQDFDTGTRKQAFEPLFGRHSIVCNQRLVDVCY